VETCAGSGRGSVVAAVLKKILVIQTAFIGDAILALPLIQILKQQYPQASIDVMVVPRAADIFTHHPAISSIIQYDKRGIDKGIRGVWHLARKLRKEKYDLAVVPHRSFRSALVTRMLNPSVSIGFDRSAFRWLFKKIVAYDRAAHEIERNLALLNPLNLHDVQFQLPQLFPSKTDIQKIDSLLKEYGLDQYKNMIAVAPGTIWNTKRWPAERFAAVCRLLVSNQCAVVLLGGKEDEGLCREMKDAVQDESLFNLAGSLSLLQSAELIRRCTVLLSNDSAPMHLAVAMGTPVVAIFGATVPEFGFSPRGPSDVVIETKGLKCRPCSIHGGKSCPIKTFDCMLSISPEVVVSRLKIIIEKLNQ
jgi:heptosyltransferase II